MRCRPAQAAAGGDATGFPAKPVRLLVGFAPGGAGGLGAASATAPAAEIATRIARARIAWRSCMHRASRARAVPRTRPPGRFAHRLRPAQTATQAVQRAARAGRRTAARAVLLDRACAACSC